MIALQWMDFLVVREVPLERPIWVPLFLDFRIPWLIRLCRSVTSFSACSNAALICSSARAIIKLFMSCMLPLKKSSIAVLPVSMLILSRLLCTTYSMIRSSATPLGTHSVWVNKDRTTEHVRPTVRCIDK